MRRRAFLRLAATASLLLPGSKLLAQVELPSGPIEVVIPFPPGGPTDTAPRIAVEYLRPLLNNPAMVLVNKPGGGGAIAAEYAARSKPDGGTIFATSNPPLSMKTAIDKKVSYKLDDFAALGFYAGDVGVIGVRPALGIKSIEELVERARSRPDELSYASPGQGSVTHLSAELFKHVAGVKLLHVPFRGSGPSIQALLGGHVPIISVAYSAGRPLIERGDLVPLITTAVRRLPDLPDVPTMAEKGYRGAELNIWMGFFVPAATPPPLVQRLAHAVAEAARNKDMIAAIARAGMQPEYGDPARTRQLLEQEYAIVSKLAQVVDLGG